METSADTLASVRERFLRDAPTANDFRRVVRMVRLNTDVSGRQYPRDLISLAMSHPKMTRPVAQDILTALEKAPEHTYRALVPALGSALTDPAWKWAPLVTDAQRSRLVLTAVLG